MRGATAAAGLRRHLMTKQITIDLSRRRRDDEDTERLLVDLLPAVPRSSDVRDAN